MSNETTPVTTPDSQSTTETEEIAIEILPIKDDSENKVNDLNNAEEKFEEVEINKVIDNNTAIVKPVDLTIQDRILMIVLSLDMIEWGGQVLAAMCWIISVFVYGIEKTGDVLQLMAASFWMIANISTGVKLWKDTLKKQE